MIKFFRKIRQKLLTEGKLMGYFKYAFGEIALVMIGILLALQVNNWDFERIQRKNERIMLLDLKVEFQENLKDAQRVFEGNKGIHNAMALIQKRSIEGNYQQRELDSLIHFVFDWFDYTPKPGASNNLINSGNLNTISNKQLRKLLTLWSGVEDELDDDEAVALRYSEDIIIPFLAEHFPISNLEEFDGNANYYKKQAMKEFDLKTNRKLEYDMEALLQNKTFQSHISVKKMHARHNAMECEGVINTCLSILNLIEQDLKTH